MIVNIHLWIHLFIHESVLTFSNLLILIWMYVKCRKRQSQKSRKQKQPVIQHRIRVTFLICLLIQMSQLIVCANKYPTEKWLDATTQRFFTQIFLEKFHFLIAFYFIMKLQCPIEWFHFACVGLTTKPKGKWFCPKCSQDRKKK